MFRAAPPHSWYRLAVRPGDIHASAYRRLSDAAGFITWLAGRRHRPHCWTFSLFFRGSNCPSKPLNLLNRRLVNRLGPLILEWDFKAKILITVEWKQKFMIGQKERLYSTCNRNDHRTATPPDYWVNGNHLMEIYYWSKWKRTENLLKLEYNRHPGKSAAYHSASYKVTYISATST